MHDELLHTPLGQTFPQRPQFSGSVAKSSVQGLRIAAHVGHEARKLVEGAKHEVAEEAGVEGEEEGAAGGGDNLGGGGDGEVDDGSAAVGGELEGEGLAAAEVLDDGAAAAFVDAQVAGDVEEDADEGVA